VGLLEGVFSLGSTPRLYSEDLKAGWVQFIWKSACEEKTRRLVWNGRQPGTQLVELLVGKSFARMCLWKEDFMCDIWSV
jgi:hypothetical protein